MKTAVKSPESADYGRGLGGLTETPTTAAPKHLFRPRNPLSPPSGPAQWLFQASRRKQIPSSPASGDTARWNGSPSGNLVLTYNATFGASPNGTAILMTTAQTGSLQIESTTTSNFALRGISIEAGAGAFTFGDGAETDGITFRGGTVVGGRNIHDFTSNSGNTATLASNLALFSGGANARTLAFGGSGNWNVAAPLSLVGGPTANGSFAVTKSGAGTLTLSGVNTFYAPGATTPMTPGTVTISGGTLQVAKTASLYNSTTASWTAANIKVANTATLALNVGGTGEFTTGNVTTLLTNLGGANGTSTTGFAAGSTIAFDTSNAGGTFTVADNIANSTGSGGGAIGVTKLGTGTLDLSGNSTYTGATTVSAGKLLINGNISTSITTVSGTGTLGGSGTVGAVTVQGSGRIAPGNSIGSLTAQGNVSFQANSIFEVEIDTAASYDSLGITTGGGLNITSGAKLELINFGSASLIALNSRLQLIDYTGGIWNGGFFTFGTEELTDSATFAWADNTWRINYNDTLGDGDTSLSNGGSFVTLTAIPEPGAALLGSLGLLALLRRRRKS